jgi:hypothetical protein
MTSRHMRTGHAVRAFLGLALAGLTLAIAANAARASDKHHTDQRLVVRGDATVNDAPCDGAVCLSFTGGRVRGTPVGTGDYTGSVTLKVAEVSPNGEGGVCAPIAGDITLGAGSPDRLVLAVFGDSCQDGAGNPTTSSFTGLAHFAVKHGTGSYSGVHGFGLASFSEDAADHDRMTLVGRIAR